ncbi:hypothetical protein ACOMHN_036214 [Nucella lapillus]
MAEAGLLLWIAMAVLRMSEVTCQAVPTTNCPRYVLENEDLTCLCQPPEGSSGTVTWPGHSDNGTLSVPKVHRAQNGTRYTCQLRGKDAGEETSMSYTLLVAYGPSKEMFRITAAQQPFPTNGSQNLTLTCQAGQVYPRLDYVWRNAGCVGTPTKRSCVLVPRPPRDDDLVVLCEVSRNYRTGLPRELMTTEYRVNLTYPPLTAPQIQIQAKDSYLLRRGDNLTCLITGGKPEVSQVVFSCSDPYAEDKGDKKKDGGVSSTVTVSSLSRWRHPMRCICRGVWNVRPQYYTLTAEGLYYVEHPAVVTEFTIMVGYNGRSDGTDTLVGGSNASVLFLCSTYGRPTPKIARLSKVADPSFNATTPYHGSDDGSSNRGPLPPSTTTNWTTDFTWEMWGMGEVVRCEDMGRYVCSVDNGVGDGEEGRNETAVLYVECGPRKLWHHALNMTERGVQFSLRAFPVPDHFTYRLLDKKKNNNNSNNNTASLGRGEGGRKAATELW